MPDVGKPKYISSPSGSVAVTVPTSTVFSSIVYEVGDVKVIGSLTSRMVMLNSSDVELRPSVTVIVGE